MFEIKKRSALEGKRRSVLLRDSFFKVLQVAGYVLGVIKDR